MAEAAPKPPVTVIVLGMAGSGKTALVTRLSTCPKKPYVVNLDPACIRLPYFANIDIRDTVNYKDVMKQYKLGPNGAIVTSLNLFSTKFSDVISLIEKAPNELCVLDTPGQIEIFTWSISGTIVTESLASTLPTVVLYVIDCVKSTSPVTFMSNMLYACSILYKTRLPLIVVMNKIDVVDWSYAKDWMGNIDSFQHSLEADTSFISGLTQSMVLALDEFYRNLKICGVSAATGEGFDELYKLIEESRVIYETEYKTEWAKMKSEAEAAKEGDDNDFITENPTGSGLSDIYLKHPANESSSDSEGEEAPYHDVEDEEAAETFRKVVQQQKEMQVRRAKEAAEKKQSC